MHSTGEIEVSIYRIGSGGYSVDLRVSDPESEGEKLPVRGTAAIDTDALAALQRADPQANGFQYGSELSRQLFSDNAITAFYSDAMAVFESRVDETADQSFLLRFRLAIDPAATELHAIRWELLRDPRPDRGWEISTRKSVLFSRFMSSRDWRTIRLRAKSDLRALVAVSKPALLERRCRLTVDIDAEIQQATRALTQKGIRVTFLGDKKDSTGKYIPLTLNSLVHEMEGVDIVYLVCHGVQPEKGEPFLYMDDVPAQDPPQVTAGRLADAVAGLSVRPRVFVLASCQSAGRGDAISVAVASPDTPGDTASHQASDDTPVVSPQSALAYLLADAGVPAVVAMQGKVRVDTLNAFMPKFFEALLTDGQIDHAMAVARASVSPAPDYWMPVLFVRLKTGRIWYEPGFAGEFTKWDVLCAGVRRSGSPDEPGVVAIIGPDLAEGVMGRAGDLAQQLAIQYAFPLATSGRSDLASVAQYVSAIKNPAFVREEVLRSFQAEVVSRFGPALPGIEQMALHDMLEQVAIAQRGDDDAPFRILADLPLRYYLTAALDTLMWRSLEQASDPAATPGTNARKRPVPKVSQMRPSPDQPSVEEVTLKRDGTISAPVVLHVFGTFDIPESLVLTEDDFVDFAICATLYKLIPLAVRSALTSNSLLFLGFSLNSWSFRILFRLIMMLDGIEKLNELTHVGVQVDPENGQFEDAVRARNYLQDYFASRVGGGQGRKEPKIDIYWGSATDFLMQLRDQMKVAPAHPQSAPIRSKSGAAALRDN